jgi:DNA invertase Pin-like site-specific DNA recombinase
MLPRAVREQRRELRVILEDPQPHDQHDACTGDSVMIAAIYARKSTEQTGTAEEAKSVTRQIDHARAYAAMKGWTVAEAHIYVDDGISGAEFAKRSGLVRLINALTPRPPFQVLVMSEESRLGREQIETAYLLKQIITCGVRVVYYLEDRERTLDSPTDKILLAVSGFADEVERDKARQRTYDAMCRKALTGHVTGGVVFGYENVPVLTPDGKRDHVERRILEPEAAVVRRIFTLSAEGAGHAANRAHPERRGGARAPASPRGMPPGVGPGDDLRHAHPPAVPGRDRVESEQEAQCLGCPRAAAPRGGGVAPCAGAGAPDRP